jgi:hypothetical protein
MDLFSTYATDEKAETEGTWIPKPKGCRVKVARLGNRAYARSLSKAIADNDLALKTGDDAADKLSDEIMARVLATTILLDLEGYTYNGETIDGSNVENRFKALLLKDFRKEILDDSSKFENFKAKQEAEQGNA